MKQLNITQRTLADTPKGIYGMGSFMTLTDFNDVSDPLAQGAAAINKPASSIPNMFARMLFFRTAYQSCTTVPTFTGTAYAKFVSDSLYLLEDLFSCNSDIEIVEWDKNRQLATLANNSILHDAIFNQMQTALPGIAKIYLFVENGMVIGGTSPYTMVYTSPNWVNNRPVKMLTERAPQFREFMYKFAAAFAGDVTFNGGTMLKEFIDFINSSKLFDRQYLNTNYAGLWSVQTLKASYGVYEMDTNNPVVINPSNNLMLYHRDTSIFDSEYFLDSDIVAFNQVATPLFVANGLSAGVRYYDGKVVNISNLIEHEDEKNDVTSRPLPDCPYQHIYLSPIDFLEKGHMIKLPYPINAERWALPILINDGMETCLLPLKPMLFSND